MRSETAPIVKQLQALKHEPSHQLAVQLLRTRLAHHKNRLVDVEDETWRKIQGEAQECKELLHLLTGEHRRALAP